MSYQETMPEPLRAQIRDRLAQVLAETEHTGKLRCCCLTMRCCAR